MQSDDWYANWDREDNAMQARDAALHDGCGVGAIICAAKILLPGSASMLLVPAGPELGAPETSHISINLLTSVKTPEGEVPMALTLSL